MLPIVTEETRKILEDEFQKDEKSWRKDMINHIKEENPEINSLLLEAANKWCTSDADKKKVIVAGYLVYKALEMAQEEEAQEALEFN